MHPRLPTVSNGRDGAPARVSIVSDEADWTREALRRCLELDGVAPERVGWPEAGRLTKPPAALVVRAGRGVREVEPDPFETWAGRAWQPLTIVSLAPVPGAAELSRRLEALRFRSTLWHGTAEAWERVEPRLAELIARPVWIVPALADALEVRDPRVVEALSVAVLRQPEKLSIPRWAGAAGLVGYRDLEGLFSRRGLPPPKRVLEWVRLISVVEHGRTAAGTWTRERLARRFGYSSADYLGRRAKALSGRSLGRLLTAGPRETLRLLVGGASSG